MLLHVGDNLPKAIGVWDFLKRWDLDPVVMTVVFVIGLVYVAGLARIKARNIPEAVSGTNVAMFVFGFLAFGLALISPISAYADDLFFMHMIQHVLLMFVAAPLLLLSNSMPVVMWSMPRSLRYNVGDLFVPDGLARKILEKLTKPMSAFLFYALVMVVWHIPIAYDASLEYLPLHYFMHITMFVAGLVFWWPAIGPAPLKSQLPYPGRMLYLFVASLLCSALGIILTFYHGYSFYENVPGHWNISMRLDQQLGGLIMWVPVNLLFLSALSAVFFAWAGKEERDNERWERIEQKRSRYMAELARNSRY